MHSDQSGQPIVLIVSKATKASITTRSANTIICWLPVLEVCELGIDGNEEFGEGVNELAGEQPLVQSSEEGLRYLRKGTLAS